MLTCLLLETIINQRGIRRFGPGGKGDKKDQDDVDTSSASTSSGGKERSSSKTPKDEFGSSGMRQRSQTLVEPTLAVAKKTMDLEKEQKGNFMDNFNMQMLRFEAEMTDKIVRIDLF